MAYYEFSVRFFIIENLILKGEFVESLVFYLGIGFGIVGIVRFDILEFWRDIY